jgi:ABC-type multidrug transport system fused ATPase/permease subunit
VPHRTTRDLVASYLRPERPRLAVLGGLFAVGIGLQLANPVLAGTFIDRATAAAPFSDLVRIAAAFLAVAVLSQVASVAEVAVAEDLGWRTTNALRVDLTAHVLALDEAFHADHGAGELLERIDGDVAAIAGFFSRFVVQVLGSGVFLVGVLAMLWHEDLRIGALLSAVAAASVWYLARRGGFVGRRSRESRAVNADLSDYLEERLSALPDLKANGADEATMAGLHERLARRFHVDRASLLAASFFSSGASVALVAATVASLALSGWLHERGQLTLGGVYLVFRYTTMLRNPLERLTRHLSSFQRATGAIVRIAELVEVEPTLVGGDAPLPPGPLAVALEHVGFAYDDAEVLHDVTFAVEPGHVLGVVGRTGSGKTTVARLLTRLYDVGEGAVRLGGVDVREVRTDDLRRRVGLVTQDVQLLTGTVRDNVRLFDPAVDDGAVEGALGALGLTPWLATLPDGLDTVVGAGASGLSAGEAQLVALARAFLEDPGLVVLDEASSRLDPRTEELVEAAVDRLLAGRTAVVIAHRLATLRRADEVLVLEGGAVVEHGDRVALAGDPTSRFAGLLRAGADEVPA